MLQRHEDLVGDPERVIESLHGHIGLEPIERGTGWAQTNLRRIRRRVYAEDPRWQEGYDLLDLRGLLDSVGYEPVFDTGGSW